MHEPYIQNGLLNIVRLCVIAHAVNGFSIYLLQQFLLTYFEVIY